MELQNTLGPSFTHASHQKLPHIWLHEHADTVYEARGQTSTYSGQAWAWVWRRLGSTCWQTCWETTEKKNSLKDTKKKKKPPPKPKTKRWAAVLLVCMCVLSGSDCVFLRKRTAFSFSSFRMRRPRLDLIWIHQKHSPSCSWLLHLPECASHSCSPTNLFQLLFLQRLGLLCQVFKLILFLQLLLPPLNLWNSSALMLTAEFST